MGAEEAIDDKKKSKKKNVGGKGTNGATNGGTNTKDQKNGKNGTFEVP